MTQARVDVTVPTAARIYDFLLGGMDNYPADRSIAHRLMALVPDAAEFARANRRFLVRAVRLLAEQGVTQFIDLGSGMPAEPAVHEVAQAVRPESVVVYVDNDPIATAHSRALHEGREGVAVVAGDLRRPAEVLAHPDTLGLIDFGRPVAVLMLSVLHFVPDEAEPDRILAAYRDALPTGSHLVLTSTSSEGFTPEQADDIGRAFRLATESLHLRSRTAIRGYLSGLDLLDPGLVDVHLWRAHEPVLAGKLLAAVGRVR